MQYACLKLLYLLLSLKILTAKKTNVDKDILLLIYCAWENDELLWWQARILWLQSDWKRINYLNRYKLPYSINVQLEVYANCVTRNRLNVKPDLVNTA